ncbi:MAG: hypothetical protein AAFX06_15910 [Planctomycetota bacterium]
MNHIKIPRHATRPLGDRATHFAMFASVCFLLSTSGCRAVSTNMGCDEAGICDPVVIESLADDEPVDDKVRLAQFPMLSSRRQHIPQPDHHSISELIVSQVEPIGPPTVVGTELNEPQMLASEHALKLKDENEQLQTRVKALESELGALREKFATTSDLLDRMNFALADAQQTLEQAETANQLLKRQIADLESQLKRERSEAARQLRSIQEELDSVFANEIISDS